jgi:tRNA threonylcarbamoyladenosine biosynthesis protein TsaB
MAAMSGLAEGPSGPPRILAIESATRRASVALMQGDHLLGAMASEPGQQHAEQLLPMLDALLTETGLGLDAVDAFAISIGPGAFTSLRIGLSTLKGLAFGSDRPVVAISTLEVLARSAEASGAWRPSDGHLIPALDARREEVYACAYAADGFVQIDSPSSILPDGVYTAAFLHAGCPGKALVVGEGAAVVAENLPGAGDISLRCETDLVVEPSASVLARIAQPRLAAGAYVAAENLVPRYVRRAEAEVTRSGQRFE